jgi:peptide/nickel transport system ATP-binding protein
MKTLLDVRELTVSFARSTPVQDLSLSIMEGETVALVGESGSGKSLTGLALMGLLPLGAAVTSGSISIGGRDMLALREPEMRKVRGRLIAMVFQEPMTSLNPILTIGYQITEAVRAHEKLSARQARTRAIELLDLVRIADPRRRIDEYPHQFSGGMRQRAMIAMAIACGPSMLIADEPTTALDVTIQAQVLDLMDRLRRQLSMALLLITHDLSVVSRWADRVVVLYAGKKMEEGTSQEIFDNPVHPYTRGLLAASPRSIWGYHYREGPLKEIPGNIDSAAGETGCPFAPRCSLSQPSCTEREPTLARMSATRTIACPVVQLAHVAP